MTGQAPRKRSWSELTGAQRAGIFGAATVQLGLLGAALNDLRQRKPREVNGDKRVWTAVSFVNIVGPLAYFAFGRRR